MVYDTTAMDILSCLKRVEQEGGELSSADDSEIERLQEQAGGRLPDTYVEFIRLAGHGAFIGGQCLADGEYTVSAIDDDAQLDAREIFRDSGRELAPDAFAIGIHDATGFVFINLDAPGPVYSYTEGDEEPRSVAPDLGDFLDALVAEFIADATGKPPSRLVPWREDLKPV